MKRRKLDLKPMVNDIYNKGIVRASKEENEYFFEIGKELTSDVAEAVAILMRKVDFNEAVWNLEVSNIVLENITPERCLFWLTGGREEWVLLDHFTKNWSDCYLDFQEEFGFLVIHLVKKSGTLGELKNNFSKYLNLPVLYDFALSKGLVK